MAKAQKSKLQEKKQLIEKDNYSVEEAAELLPKLSTSGFVGSCELNVVLKIKDSKKNQPVRGSIVFPNQFGETKRVIVLAGGDDVEKAKKAGADEAGLDELVKKIEDGWLEFDVAIATPDVMPKIAKLGKVLGPRQMMPNPKTGTVTKDVEQAVKSYKSGKTDFKLDDGNSIKLKFGKCDMKTEELAANLTTALEAITSEAKKLGGDVVKKILVSPTMGPSVAVSY